MTSDWLPRPAGWGIVLALACCGLSWALPSGARAESFSKRTLHFIVHVGSAGDQPCNIVGDLYRPADATAAHPDPAILTTNGFGGSKNDQATFANEFASQGYVVLSYSGLGFGGSSCPIELDDPDWDGKAASQLITFLGGGLAATDGTTVDYVIHDAVAHDGRHYSYDPRVGTIGGSYGGGFQFSLAGQDPRVDALVPIITWNNLNYSLAPNNEGLTDSTVTSSVPGAAKIEWGLLLFADGLGPSGIAEFQQDPTAVLSTCPDFPPALCAQAIQLAATGYPSPALAATFTHDSVASYISRIRVPTLLMQGQDDTLFNLHEAVATYERLKAQGTPVKMVWQSWGHSHGTPAAGELGDGSGGYGAYDASGHLTYEGQTILEWFNHYLKDDPKAPSLDFSFFRPWVTYTGDADTAYGRAASYPVGATKTLDLSGTDSLVSPPASVTSGSSTFLTTAAGAPTSYSEISAIDPGSEPFDLPGTYAEYETPPLSANTDVNGIPSADVHVSAALNPGASALGPGGDLVLFFKLYDISPSGVITLPDKLISPVRIADPNGVVHVTLPGIVHRFAAGDRIALVIAGGDSAYRGNTLAEPVTISTTAASPGVLRLPVATPSSYGPVVYAAAPPSRRRHRKHHHKRARHHRPARHAKPCSEKSECEPTGQPIGGGSSGNLEPTSSSAGGLPFTGEDVLAAILAGLVLVGAGRMLGSSSRRKPAE